MTRSERWALVVWGVLLGVVLAFVADQWWWAGV